MSNKYEDLIKNARVNAECGEHMSPEEVTTLLNVVETTFAALAAENAGLKNALEWLYETASSESVSIPDEKYSSVTNAAQVLGETPATDSFLAEVRAQGVDVARNAMIDFVEGEVGPNENVPGLIRAAEICVSIAANLRKGVQS